MIIHCVHSSRKLSSIEDRGLTDCVRIGVMVRVRLGLELTLTFNLRRVMVMTHTHAKGQCQKSVGLKDRVERDRRTGRRTDGGQCITSRANAVGKDH